VERLLLALSLLLAFTTPALPRAWPDYQIIEWQPATPAELATLKRIGVTTGMVSDPKDPGPLKQARLHYYVENIATDFYSAYHRWSPTAWIGARFAALQERYAADPADLSVFNRDPSLSDPVWLHRIEDRLTRVVHTAAPDHPLYYNLGDETGIADLAAPWDFDLSPVALAAFRNWLQTQYHSLAALNSEWGTSYTSWSEVIPELTQQAIEQTNNNYARWSDFKAWMDKAFADSLKAGTDAVHKTDPSALAAIEGAQVPGWGGYNYLRLARVVDMMEINPADENLAILRSQNPAIITLTTSFRADPQGLHMVWQAWLEGCRGLVLWNENHRISALDGALRPDGRAYAPVFAALRGPVGQAVLNATPIHDKVAVLYSPASFRIHWLLEQKPNPTAWITRSPDDDPRGNAQRQALAATGSILAHLGLSPTYIGPAQLARGDLHGARVLILPGTIALSEADIQAIRVFAAAGGHIVTDAEPGLFDQHGRRRADAPLADLFTGARAAILPLNDRTAMRTALREAGVKPEFPLSVPDATIYAFTGGRATIIAIQRDFSADAGPEHLTVTLPRPFLVSDLRTGATLGRLNRVTLTLDPVTPGVLRLRSL
jgi:glycosyl hydrolase family 42 (putative beta-galactosidase)